MLRKQKVVSSNLCSKYFCLTGEDNGHFFFLNKIKKKIRVGKMKIVTTDNAFKDRAKKWSRVKGNN